MAQSYPKLIVFVHGWSVTHTNTYGGLPDRLVNESRAAGLSLVVRQIYLGRYISFHDEVRLQDISRAFQDAVSRELTADVNRYGRFACITHSTGGPVIRDWWWRYYQSDAARARCPMSHLVMLAPANFGSALAQLGKARVGRLKSWFDGAEPGTGVLDWLELGSPEAWELNQSWIDGEDSMIGPRGIFPFVLIGQSIDRKFYDHLNTYTGETGSDGVVRVAAANLNSSMVTLRQSPLRRTRDGEYTAPDLQLTDDHSVIHSPRTALRVLANKSHSGKSIGIMRSVSARAGTRKDAQTIAAIIDCLKILTRRDYTALCNRFDRDTAQVQSDEQVEVEVRSLLPNHYFIHDRYSMVIFRLRDEAGRRVEDFDLVLTAGANDDPNHLPQGFALDRQGNKREPGTITYYFNWDIMAGCKAVEHNGRELRPASTGAQALGLRVIPRPTRGFVHYLPCGISASTELLEHILLPNQTTLVDITLQRIVHRNVFQLSRGTRQGDFKNTRPGDPIS